MCAGRLSRCAGRIIPCFIMQTFFQRWLLPLVFFAPFLTVATAVDGLGDLGGWRHYQILPIFFLLVPLMELLLGRDRSNVDAATEETRRRNQLYRVITWLWVPTTLTVTIWTLWVVATKDPTWVQLIGLAITTGFINGIVSIVFAHELMHRSTKLEPILAEILLTLVTYTHFRVEHVYGHHLRVATPDDPASARFGESFYRFLPRVLRGEFLDTWQIESARQARRQRSRWSLQNRLVRYVLTWLVIYGVIAVVAGWQGLIWFALQSLIGITMLAMVNYLEHYGLTRREIAPGRFEPVEPWHSWDAYHRTTNIFLINLGRHSDHHMRAGRPYQVLRYHASAGQLPVGYVTLLVLMLVPPLWFKVMNPRVRALRAVHGNPLPEQA